VIRFTAFTYLRCSELLAEPENGIAAPSTIRFQAQNRVCEQAPKGAAGDFLVASYPAKKHGLLRT
jgi:hypothetical protein